MKKTGSESVTTSSVQNQMALCHQAMVEITKQFLMFELQQSNISFISSSSHVDCVLDNCSVLPMSGFLQMSCSFVEVCIYRHPNSIDANYNDGNVLKPPGADEPM